MNKDIYITTTIPYVNAKPHIGHALELVQADVIARYFRLIKKDVTFQTGTDENAFKNVLSAQEKGLSTRELVNENSGLFKNLVKKLNISADNFIRTTENRHKLGVNHFWKRLKPDDIYKKNYNGLYCNGCEDFINEKELVNGVCVEHNTPPIEVKELNYFFRLSGYQDKLKELIENDKIKIIPDTRKNEVLQFINHGLKDISISRDAKRVCSWGIPVPEDDSQIIYVWIDALINYITGPGFDTDDIWQKIWNKRTKKIHAIGKNVWKFHAIYWPALLLSANLPLPDEIFVHGFLTVNGQKISKSIGNVIDPFECISKYGCDTTRYYLLKAVSSFQDGNFSFDRLESIYNSDLANCLGNLFSRLTVLCEKADFNKLQIAEQIHEPPDYKSFIKNYEFDKALTCLWVIITNLNQEIDKKKPWEILKNNDTDKAKEHLNDWLSKLYVFSYWLQPFLPETSSILLNELSKPTIKRTKQLFPRIE